MEKSQDWISEFKTAFRTSKDLFAFLEWEHPKEDVTSSYPLFIPHRLARKIKAEGPQGVLAREFLPDAAELNPEGLRDPIGDNAYLKAPQLIHRYRSRALFAPTTLCPVNCRYCFRKNELSLEEEIFQQDFPQTIQYLKDHPEISEVIFTGGDPLNLSNQKLEKYLIAFAEIPSIKDIRFHTRYPVILPSRVDDELLKLLSQAGEKFRTVSLALHANHLREFDTEVDAAIERLKATGVQLLTQTVLLKGVNDNLASLRDLMNHFIELKIRPYYLHHPDQVKGGLHFYLSLAEGRRLYQELRSELPGWALPHYVIDVPGGHGKTTAFNPESLSFQGELMALDGELIPYQEPDQNA